LVPPLRAGTASHHRAGGITAVEEIRALNSQSRRRLGMPLHGRLDLDDMRTLNEELLRPLI
jgi:hypothetical protein